MGIVCSLAKKQWKHSQNIIKMSNLRNELNFYFNLLNFNVFVREFSNLPLCFHLKLNTEPLFIQVVQFHCWMIVKTETQLYLNIIWIETFIIIATEKRKRNACSSNIYQSNETFHILKCHKTVKNNFKSFRNSICLKPHKFCMYKNPVHSRILIV